MADLRISGRPPSTNTEAASETSAKSSLPEEVKNQENQTDPDSSAKTTRALKQQASEVMGQQNITSQLMRNNLDQALSGQPNVLFSGQTNAPQPTVVAAPTPTNVPKPEVRQLQESLNKFRAATGQPTIKENGIMDAETRKAMQEFQHLTGLPKGSIDGPAINKQLSNMLKLMDQPIVAENLSKLFASQGFRDLPQDMKTDVLKRIQTYAATPGKLDNISILTDLINQQGFEKLSASGKKLMLDAMAARPDNRDLANSFGQLLSSGLTKLDESTQNFVLKRIKSYGGDQAKIDNLENLITTTSRFEELPKETQRMMLNSHVSDPKNSELVDKLSKTASHPDFRTFDPHLQHEALDRMKQYPADPDQVDNLMGLLKNSGFQDLPSDIREQVFKTLPGFGRGQLDPDKLMRVVGAFGWKHMDAHKRELMLEEFVRRPDNPNVANALRDLAEDVTFIHDKTNWFKKLGDAMAAIP